MILPKSSAAPTAYGLFVVLTLLAGCGAMDSLFPAATPAPAPLSGAALEERFPDMLLQSSDLPPGFVVWSEGYQRNEELLAQAGGDANMARALRNSGRQSGYLSLYQPLTPTDAALEGIFVVLELFDTPDQASDALYRDPRQVTGTAMRRTQVEALADETVAYTTTSQGSTIHAVWFRSDRLTAAVYTSTDGAGSLEETRSFAERLLVRMRTASQS